MRPCRAGRRRLPGWQHGSEDRVRGALRDRVRRPRADHVPRPPGRPDPRSPRARDRPGAGARMSGGEVRVIRNRYVDSVRLMQVAQVVRGHDGVSRAEVAMGTAANLAALGVSCDATPTDVVIAVQGGGDGALEAAEAQLRAPATSDGARAAAPPRSLLGSGANVALISLPGEYAVLEAHRALT